jgi:hypothetical protein
MTSPTAPKPATMPMPVQLSAPEFEALLLPHLSMPKRGPQGKLGYYRAFAKWADDGLLERVFIARMGHLAAEKHLDLSILHGDGTNTVATREVMGLATQAPNIRRGRRSSPSRTTMAMCERPSLWLP